MERLFAAGPGKEISFPRRGIFHRRHLVSVASADMAHADSNHYGDSLIGFALMIFAWSFVGAAIYTSTKSSLACAVYHTFINSIGAVYDWNALFDAYPKTNGMMLYFAIILLAAVVILRAEHKKTVHP